MTARGSFAALFLVLLFEVVIGSSFEVLAVTPALTLTVLALLRTELNMQAGLIGLLSAATLGDIWLGVSAGSYVAGWLAVAVSMLGLQYVSNQSMFSNRFVVLGMLSGLFLAATAITQSQLSSIVFWQYAAVYVLVACVLQLMIVRLTGFLRKVI